MYMCQFDFAEEKGHTLDQAYSMVCRYLIIEGEGKYTENNLPEPEDCCFYKLTFVEIETRLSICEKR